MRDLTDKIFNPVTERCHNNFKQQNMNIFDWMSTDAVRKAFHVPDKVQKQYETSN